MVIKAIFDRARREPDRAAMSANGMNWTYAQLAQGILDAEARISSFALPPEARVGIAVRELAHAWFFILAAEKMGRLATALPGNSTAPQIGMTGIGLWIADGNVEQSWTGPTLWLEEGTRIGFDERHDIAKPVVEPAHDFRFVLYSSGTTGLYKRIVSRGAARDARIALAIEEARATGEQRHYVGDFGPWTAHGYTQPIRALTVGSLLVFEQRMEPWNAILAHRPTDFFMTPGTARRFFQTLPASFPRQDQMKVTVSGGALTPALLETIQSRLTRNIVQIYASTESGLIARTTISGPEDLLDHRIANTGEIQAVDDQHRPLPFGQEGTLRVRRPGMAESYFEDPVATAEHFRDGWFYPGDVGIVWSETRFRLTGRASEVINANGDKIAPALLEDAIRAEWRCADVAVLSQANTGAKDSLHIFVVDAKNLDEKIAKESLKSLTPSFLRIQVHHTDAIPRTTTGKIQYRLLRDALRKN